MKNFRRYLGLLVRISVSSSLVLGLAFGIWILFSGGTTAEIDLTIEFGRFEGFWMVILFPVVSLLLLGLAAPLSYVVYRRLTGSRDPLVEPDEQGQ